jgi:hypothetical protein
MTTSTGSLTGDLHTTMIEVQAADHGFGFLISKP